MQESWPLSNHGQTAPSNALQRVISRRRWQQQRYQVIKKANSRYMQSDGYLYLTLWPNPLFLFQSKTAHNKPVTVCFPSDRRAVIAVGEDSAGWKSSGATSFTCRLLLPYRNHSSSFATFVDKSRSLKPRPTSSSSNSGGILCSGFWLWLRNVISKVTEGMKCLWSRLILSCCRWAHWRAK